MAEILQSKTSKKTWTTPEAFHADYVKADPTFNGTAQELWQIAEKDPDYKPLTHTQFFGQDRGGSYAIETMKNAPGSMLDFGINTAKGLIKLGSGIISRAAGDTSNGQPQSRSLVDDIKSIPSAAGNLWDSYFGPKGKFGSTENTLRTIMRDPAGTAGDVSLVATGVGGVARGLSKASSLAGATKTARALNTTANTTQQIGRAANPINIASQAATRPFRAIPAVERKVQRMAENRYISAIGDSKHVEDKEIHRPAVQVMLKNEAPLNAKGLKINQDLVDAKDTLRSLMVKNADDAARNDPKYGGTIDPVYGNLGDLRDKMGVDKMMSDRKVSMAEVDSQIADLAADLTTQPGVPVFPSLMHDKLKGMNKSLNEHYGRINRGTAAATDPASVASKMEAATGLRDSLKGVLNKYNPGMGDDFAKLGFEEKQLLDLQDEMNRIVKHKTTGLLKDPPSETAAKAKMASGNWNMWAFFSMVKNIANNPNLMSRLAINVSKKGIPQSKLRAAINMLSSAGNDTTGIEEEPTPTEAPPTQRPKNPYE